MELNQVEKGQVEQNQTNQVPPVSPTPTMTSIPPKRSKKWWVVLIIVLIVIASGAGYYYWNNQQSQNDNSKLENDQTDVPTADSGQTTTSDTSSTTPKATTDETADWKTYTNTEYGFSFKYPDMYSVSINKGNLLTVNIDYPTGGLSRGITIGIRNDTVSNATKDLTTSNGFIETSNKIIASRQWKTYEYDPDNDTNATDQSNTLNYYIEYANKLYYIVGNTKKYSDEITDEKVRQIFDQILSTFKFTP